MLKRVSQKLNHMMLPPSLGAVPGKPMLDFVLGIAILKDRRVAANVKLLSVLWGGIVTLMVAQIELLLCHALKVGMVHGGFVGHVAAYFAGMTLFTVLAAIRIVPIEDATRLRYARHGVIPVKVRKD